MKSMRRAISSRNAEKRLMYKVTITDEASEKAHVKLRTPNRKVLWEEQRILKSTGLLV